MLGFPRVKAVGRGRIIIKTPREIDLMMKACEVSAMALKLAGDMIVPGITTREIDRMIGEYIKKCGGKPSFKGLYGFVGNACISVNHELIHGIPSKKRFLRNGDIVSIDVGAFLGGYHGDNAATFSCGEVSEAAVKLIRTTEQSLRDAVAQCYSGNRIGDISNVIQLQCEGNGYFIPEDYLGHGVGKDLHEDPSIPNHGPPGRGPRLTPGMTLAIEPMVCSTTKKTRVLPDKWTVVEANGNLAAHFEHTVLITSGEPIVMTKLR
jgi:methionyl aminopeptidase